jgi:hypothetical protein
MYSMREVVARLDEMVAALKNLRADFAGNETDH